MSVALPFVDAKKIDQDLIDSIALLADGDAQLATTHGLPRLLKQLQALPPDQLIDPLVYAWYREFALSVVPALSNSGLVVLGLDSIGSAWPHHASIAVGEFTIVPPGLPHSPYTTEALTSLLTEGSESEGRLVLAPLPQAQVDGLSQDLDQALKLFDRVAPAEAHQWRQSVRMIIPVLCGPDSDFRMDGGSSLFLPGVLALNINESRTRLELLAVLVHEAAHIQLNSLCQYEPLSYNGPNDSYESPLRRDSRPMEGVLHAGYVCTVVAGLFQKIAAHPQCQEVREEAEEVVRIALAPLPDTIAIIDEHALLSTQGHRVVDAIKQVQRTSSALA